LRTNAPCWYYSYALFKILKVVVKESNCDCIALSGGIDSSTVLAAAISEGIKPRGYASVYRNGLPKDIAFLNHISKLFNLEVKYVFIDDQDIEGLRKSIVECIGEEKLNSHKDGGCIEFRNDAVFYSVIRKAKEDGCKCIYTGSGGDEIFAGYSFLLSKESDELDSSIKKLAYGRFPELEIAECLKMRAIAPFLDDRLRSFALSIPVNCLRSNEMRGKDVLREILRGVGLKLIAERAKVPAESGSGTRSMCTSPLDEYRE
jgi:asparagine synthase (glutamine-hydrolysing)